LVGDVIRLLEIKRRQYSLLRIHQAPPFFTRRSPA
jgi:hypothetical protein